MKPRICLPDLEVEVNLTDNPPMVAYAKVFLALEGGGRVEARGFRLFTSKHFNERIQAYLNIKPPSARSRGGWITQLKLDEESFFLLEKAIYERYLSVKKKLKS